MQSSPHALSRNRQATSAREILVLLAKVKDNVRHDSYRHFVRDHTYRSRCRQYSNDWRGSPGSATRPGLSSFLGPAPEVLALVATPRSTAFKQDYTPYRCEPAMARRYNSADDFGECIGVGAGARPTASIARRVRQSRPRSTQSRS
jgi:hypothetical protein